MNSYLIRRGGLPPSILHAAMDAIDSSAASALRADAAFVDADPSSVLWALAMDNARGDHGAVQALRAGLRDMGRTKPVRADSQFFAADLNVNLDGGRVYVRPKSKNALLDAIPIRSIDTWADTFTAHFGETAGVAEPYRTDGTMPPLVSSEVQEQAPRPILTLWNALPEGYVLRQQRAQVGRSMRSDEVAQAVYGHARAMNLGLISGISGFGGWSLQTHPGFLRRLSTVTYGATGTGARDAMYEDLSLSLQTVGLSNPQVDISAPDTLITTSRIMAALQRPSNFEAGGYVSAATEMDRILAGNGISAVVIADELRDYGGTGIDGMLLFNRADEDGLRHVLPLRPSPIATETANLTTLQYFMSRTGLLYARQPRGVLIVEQPVSV